MQRVVFRQTSRGVALAEHAGVVRLPPALETFVWAPLWTYRTDRRPLSQGTYDGHRAAVRQYAERTLRELPTLRAVLYKWHVEGYFRCVLSGEGEVEERPAAPEDVDEDTWAYV